MSRAKVVTVISLVLNVFLIGAVVGGLYGWMSHERDVKATQQRGLRFAASELSAERQAAFMDALKATRRDPASRSLAAAARAGRMEVAQALLANDFNAAALTAALTSTRDADMQLRARVEGTVAAFAATLSPDERGKLVDAMQRHGPLGATRQGSVPKH
jgi:uncharacterized membrane protein